MPSLDRAQLVYTPSHGCCPVELMGGSQHPCVQTDFLVSRFHILMALVLLFSHELSHEENEQRRRAARGMKKQ